MYRDVPKWIEVNRPWINWLHMNTVHLLPVGKVDDSLLHDLRAAIPHFLPVTCEILPAVLDPIPSYHTERQQYHSSEILQRMQPLVRPYAFRLLAIADVDLYILPAILHPTPSYHTERHQYHSSEILQRMQPLVRPYAFRLLAIADVDLY